MSWNLTKSELPISSNSMIETYFRTEFKETHLGPLKNSLGSRSTSTSTIKADTPEPMDDKISTPSSNGIGKRATRKASAQADDY